MKLPNGGAATIAPAKLVDYLLNPANRQNRGKAQRFGGFGFTLDLWPKLGDALAEHAAVNDVIDIVSSEYGIKYVVRCNLITPDGRNPCMTSVWLIDEADTSPRLVTAY